MSAIDDWLDRLRSERGQSPKTLASYRRDLERLLRLALPQHATGAQAAADGAPRAAGDAGPRVAGDAGPRVAADGVPRVAADRDPDWSAIGDADIRRWVAQSAREGLSARSIARHLSSWRGFFDWLAREGRVASNPARAVRGPKRPRRLPKAMAVDQTMQMLDANPAQPHEADQRFEGVRDQAIAELLYSSGLRLSELTSLDAGRHDTGRDGYRSSSWFDAAAAEVTVLGKGGKRRSVPVGGKAMQALALWNRLRSERLSGLPSSEGLQPALFITWQGRRLSNRAVQSRLRALALRRDVAVRVHPHVLRHSFASHLLQSSGDLRAVQELLGHADIATTQVYTALDFQHLATVYDSAHPRARRRKPTG